MLRKKVKERQNLILRLLREKKQIDFQELAKICKVHEMTIRRDCAFLEKQGFLLLKPKGIQYIPRDAMRTTGEHEIKEFETERRNIARYILDNIIQDNETIFIGPGIISLFLLEELDKDPPKKLNTLQIYTNAYELIAFSFAHYRKNFRVFSSGGELNPMSNCFYGDNALRSMNSWKIDKYFIEPFAISIEMNQALINNNFESSILGDYLKEKKNIYLIADSQVFNRLAMFPIISLDCIKSVITDENISREVEKTLGEYNIEIFK